MADHFYTTRPDGELAEKLGYLSEGIAGFVQPKLVQGAVPLFRRFHPKTGNHFYTADATEADQVISKGKYIDEGISCFVLPQPASGAVPLFRLYSKERRNHFFTTSVVEVTQHIRAGYDFEGISCFIYPKQVAGSQPLFRWFKPDTQLRITFAESIAADQRNKLRERHEFAYQLVKQTDKLSPKEIGDVLNVFHQAIHFDIDTDPMNNAKTTVGGRTIWVNFTNLFPQGDEEIAQTLLHEMMHCAGYRHPARRFCNPDKPNEPCDVPGDNGPYYSTPPLRAELAIANLQSDLSCEGGGKDGYCKQRCKPGAYGY